MLEQAVAMVAGQLENKLDAQIDKLDNMTEGDLDNIRMKRIADMKKRQAKMHEWIAKGEGPCTGSAGATRALQRAPCSCHALVAAWAMCTPHGLRQAPHGACWHTRVRLGKMRGSLVLWCTACLSRLAPLPHAACRTSCHHPDRARPAPSPPTPNTEQATASTPS
jgi:hypothetical protein